MGGSSSVTGDQTIYHTDNMCFDGTDRGAPMASDGQLWIGCATSNRANNGGHVRLGQITSPLGTLAIGYSAPNITMDITGGAKAVEHLTGDSGGQLNPDGSNNFNVLGRSGSKTSGSGSTLTIKSPPYADAGGSATSTLNSGSFVTGAFTLTLPASAGLADGDLFEYVATSAASYVIQAVGSQKIRIGNTISSAAGTATSDGLAGTALVLRFRASDGFFYAISTIGTFVLA